MMADREHQEWMANRKDRKNGNAKKKPKPEPPPASGGPQGGGTMDGGGDDRDRFDPVLW